MEVMWSVDDLANYLHVSRKTIFNRIWRREELPPFIKTGRTILFREGDVKKWLDSNCIAIANTKGGSGKTTLTANLGAYLACCGWRVLLIDADIQPTLSNYFPIEANKSGLTSMMTELNTNTSINRVPDQEMDIIYSDDPDGRLHEWIMRQPDGRLRIRAAVNLFRKHYDIVLIDTQGAAGPLLEAAVMAADVIVSPVPSEILSAREFIRGMNLVLDKVRPMLRRPDLIKALTTVH